MRVHAHIHTHPPLQLLDTLPSLPNLTHLALGDVGSAHSTASCLSSSSSTDSRSHRYGAVVVGAQELQQLQCCAKLTHLELHTLRCAG
jgi:hypothetical protein